jgi:hypothetical protein
VRDERLALRAGLDRIDGDSPVGGLVGLLVETHERDVEVIIGHTPRTATKAVDRKAVGSDAGLFDADEGAASGQAAVEGISPSLSLIAATTSAGSLPPATAKPFSSGPRGSKVSSCDISRDAGMK